MGRKKFNHRWTNEEKEYLKQITAGHHRKEIQELINKKFNLNFTLDQIKGAILRNGLNTGFTGKFEKGHVPATRSPDGSENIQGGYRKVKNAKDKKWESKHRLIWEKHNGEIPKDNVIIFADGNKNNCNIENLIMISKKEMLVMNKRGLIKDNVELTKTGTIIAKILVKINKY